ASMLLGLRVEVTLEADGRRVKGHAVAGGAVPFGTFFAHPPEEVAREAVERAGVLAEAKPLGPGRLPVVLGGGWSGVWLHEAIGHAFEADNALNHQNQIGQAIAPPHVTLVDDATVPSGRGSFTHDDEGTPAQRTVLVENGVLRSFLTDRQHADQLGLPRTGNGRRQSFRHLPLPRMTNLLLAPGEASEADLIADVRDGLYVAMPGHGLVWPGEDRFAFDVLEGYRIEQGRLTHPVADVRLAGSTTDALRHVVAIGPDVRLETARGLCRKAEQTVPVSVGMPAVLLAGLQVLG
ncbi:MAG: TldD/PmbA family protein, partial [Rhodothermales bacterium]